MQKNELGKKKFLAAGLFATPNVEQYYNHSKPTCLCYSLYTTVTQCLNNKAGKKLYTHDKPTLRKKGKKWTLYFSHEFSRLLLTLYKTLN